MTSSAPGGPHLLRRARAAATLVLGLLAVLLLSTAPAQAAPPGAPTASLVTPTIADLSPIRLAYHRSGASSGPLGAQVSGEICGLVRSGCYQHYTGGSIYWSPTTGAVIVLNQVRDRWAAQGWERGALGYPISGTFCGLRDGGCGEHFEGGSVYWSPATGARQVAGVVRDRWSATGWESGQLGYPTSELFCGLRDGGCGQHFQGGSIYWTPAGGPVVVTTAVRDRWAAQGWENGPLGYPTRDTFCGLRGNGCGQHFQGGSVYRSASTPTVVVPVVFRDAWAAQGWENGPLGYPTGETFDYRGMLAQSFQGGTLVRLADGRVVRG
ncbi:hypothetical protein GCU67_06190 [Modestobacter muralis]|uniref:LGFP repeat-containing protein n=1 Tax=Modestobacter muralis TaxID=1608614 RepID=A0A6P0ERM8_9ACTN|nr:hypothetical protein [Modestobacter muralis]NEK93767.1 hypothetical protein [Modestobacter muralis]NEN50534.1 hypothetical protein [Modestobacter muralis]